jgi:S-adenosyl methyltransferase
VTAGDVGAGMGVETAPGGVDPTMPNVARTYDYFLGGKDHFAADREAGERILRVSPEVRSTLRANRSFLGRAVRFLAGEAGITQFLDLGTGLPTAQNVHQVAQGVSSSAKVVYVDYDSVVLAHARAILADDENTAVVGADLRRPTEVLSDPELLRMVDLGQPVAVLMMAVLHFVAEDENAAAIVAQYRDALPPGSYLAMSLGTTDGVDPAKIADAKQVYRSATAQLTYRSRAQIEELFDGFDLVDPGLVRPPLWRPDSDASVSSELEGSEWMLAAVGRKRA